MKKYQLFILLLFATIQVLAQTSKMSELPVPVLKRMLSESKNDTDKVQLRIAIGRAVLLQTGGGPKEVASALKIANQAITISHQINFENGVINSTLLKALCFYKKQDFSEALKIAQQALDYSQKVNNYRGMAEAYIVIGLQHNIHNPDELVKRIDYNNKAIALYKKTGNYLRQATTLKDNAELLNVGNKQTEAIKLLFESLNIYKTIGYKRVQSIYWLIGRISTDKADYPYALRYNLLAIKTATEVNDTTLLLCSIYHTMAITYTMMNDFRGALPYSLKSLEVAKHFRNKSYIDEVSTTLALEYTRTNRFLQGLAILQKLKKMAGNDRDALIATSNIVMNLTDTKQFKKAEPYIKEIKRLLEKVPGNDFDAVMPVYKNLAEYYIETKQINAAYMYTDKYARFVDSVYFLHGMRTAEKNYYQLDSIRGNFKSAMDHYLVAQKIKDSIDNVTKAYQISLLQIENDTQKKNNDIDALTRQAQVKDSELKRNQVIQRLIITGSLLLSIITGLIYSRYRLKQRSNTLLLQQKSEIDQQNTELQSLINDKNQLIIDKDELLQEKDMLLKEVNHRVKNNLQIVMSLLQSQSGYMQNKQAQEAILESQNRVLSIALIHDQLFNTDKVAEIDLASYISDLVHSLDYSINKGSYKVKINCNVDDILLDVSQAIPVGIIMNESVTNALKYGFPGNRTGEIKIVVKQIDQQIEMQISDNGVGLPVEFSLSRTKSLGINLIKGLTSQLKGTFIINDSDGVSITVKFPIEAIAIKEVAMA